MAESLSYPEHHVGRSFLEDLPQPIKRYRYQGKEHFLRTRYLELDRFECSKHDTSEYILFDIDADTLKKDFLDPGIEDNSFTFDSFDTEENLLLIKMETREHGQAIQEFGYTIMRQLDDMGLRTTVEKFTTTIQAPAGTGKRPDNGWGPTRQRGDDRHRPTVDLEVGVSESQAKLERDATFLLDPQRGNANIALTIKLNRTRAQMTLDKYEWDAPNGRINRLQRIQIAEDPSGEEVTVNNAPLIIPFEQLMERPRSSPAEKGITVGVEDLKAIADSIWRVQHSLSNGRILCPGLWGSFVSTLVVEDDHTAHVGWDNDEPVLRVQATGVIVDLKNRMVLPGFVDGHVHILNFGMSLQKHDLLSCKDLADIRNSITAYAETHPSDPRILCRGSVPSVTDGNALATVLDDLDPRPIYIESLDLHSTWCNNAALKELEADC
ncbi:unnamed protein product [Penicillium egyptiacum]|uniref:Amidohydrolase 3 domain-containing protein n=1 Tax=Penicillium egyptiacum TaxID=1303716 RepID=A0A9W4KII0_9EURO|nr:unnamed protein product [Penicillium egyptiacum]